MCCGFAREGRLKDQPFVGTTCVKIYYILAVIEMSQIFRVFVSEKLKKKKDVQN
jgi:hypothetical protein